MKTHKFVADVQTKIGHTIQTTYGPSLVVGLIYEGDRILVHLKEFGVEDYSIDIEHWEMLLQ